jgi:hypothetical protein
MAVTGRTAIEQHCARSVPPAAYSEVPRRLVRSWRSSVDRRVRASCCLLCVIAVCCRGRVSPGHSDTRSTGSTQPETVHGRPARRLISRYPDLEHDQHRLARAARLVPRDGATRSAAAGQLRQPWWCRCWYRRGASGRSRRHIQRLDQPRLRGAHGRVLRFMQGDNQLQR